MISTTIVTKNCERMISEVLESLRWLNRSEYARFVMPASRFRSAVAGRSPSYLMRQMVDMRSGTRTGTNADLMKPVVGQMNNADLMAISAYVASRAP